jgi:hypothetical protein
VTSNRFNHDQNTVQAKITPFCSGLLTDLGFREIGGRFFGQAPIIRNYLGDAYDFSFKVVYGLISIPASVSRWFWDRPFSGC